MARDAPENESSRDSEQVSSESTNTANWENFVRAQADNGEPTSGYKAGLVKQLQSAKPRNNENATTASQALLRFMQYQRRFDRRRERLSALVLTSDYEKEILRACEKWRSDSCEVLYHEIHDVVQKIKAAAVMEEINIPLNRLDEALERFKQDGDEVSRQERVLMRSENTVKHAQGKLNRVVDSMMNSARKYIDLSGILQSDSMDMISNSTINDSPTASSRASQKPPPMIERYFEKLGQRNYMFERLAEIEFARREELLKREVLLDQADPQSSEPESFRELDEEYNREFLHATKDYDQALADFASIERQCRDNKLDPDHWRTRRRNEDNDEDDDDGYEDGSDTAVPPRRPTADVLPETTNIISETLNAATKNAKTAIGPAPDDPAGLVTTEVPTGGPNGRLDVGSMPTYTVENWMESLPDQTRSRIHSTTESPVPMQQDKQVNTFTNISTEGLLALSGIDLDTIDLGEIGNVNGTLKTEQNETHMDVDSHAATDSVVDGLWAGPHSEQIKNRVFAAIDDLNQQADSMQIVPTFQQHIAAEQALELEKGTQGLSTDIDPAAQDSVMDKAETDNIALSVAAQLNTTSELYTGKESMEDIGKYHDAISKVVEVMSANAQSPRTTTNTSHQRNESGKHRISGEHEPPPSARPLEGKSNTVRWAQDLLNEHSDSPARASPTHD